YCSCLRDLSLLYTSCTYIFPYTTLFRSVDSRNARPFSPVKNGLKMRFRSSFGIPTPSSWISICFLPLVSPSRISIYFPRSEEHTSELQSRFDLVCRLLLEKKKIMTTNKRLRN